VATSTLRAVILVAAVALGALVIRNAFPENASRSITTLPPTGKKTSPPSASPTAGASASPTAKPRVKGVTVQVLNGTSTTGLASTVTGQLKKAGYSMKTPGNVNTANKTTIYYQKGYKAEADYLKRRRLKDAVVAPAPSNFSANLTVVLGTDYASSSS
jgi:hypothetical protein